MWYLTIVIATIGFFRLYNAVVGPSSRKLERKLEKESCSADELLEQEDDARWQKRYQR